MNTPYSDWMAARSANAPVRQPATTTSNPLVTSSAKPYYEEIMSAIGPSLTAQQRQYQQMLALQEQQKALQLAALQEKQRQLQYATPSWQQQRAMAYAKTQFPSKTSTERSMKWQITPGAGSSQNWYGNAVGNNTAIFGFRPGQL